MQFNFKNKKVLITGGTRGIGLEIAKAFEKLNAKVILTGTKDTFISKEFNYSYEKLFISEKYDWKNQVSSIIDKYDGFDICINNAGINKINRIEDTDYKDLENIIQTNLTAPIYISSLVSKRMIENKKGSIINIGSIFGTVSKMGRNPYTATKSGIIGVTKTMAIDLAEHNILVNCVSPGFVDTELTREVLGEEQMKIMSEQIPMKRLASIKDITPIILFLCSEFNTYITGQNITVDGGFTLE
ncbi:SDR family oxidoreductase [Arcobacter sp. FW59]|nr:SDR family oxidoreductase [Arcobacter sp. FW59]